MEVMKFILEDIEFDNYIIDSEFVASTPGELKKFLEILTASEIIEYMVKHKNDYKDKIYWDVAFDIFENKFPEVEYKSTFYPRIIKQWPEQFINWNKIFDPKELETWWCNALISLGAAVPPSKTKYLNIVAENLMYGECGSNLYKAVRRWEKGDWWKIFLRHKNEYFMEPRVFIEILKKFYNDITPQEKEELFEAITTTGGYDIRGLNELKDILTEEEIKHLIDLFYKHKLNFITAEYFLKYFKEFLTPEQKKEAKKLSTWL